MDWKKVVIIMIFIGFNYLVVERVIVNVLFLVDDKELEKGIVKKIYSVDGGEGIGGIVGYNLNIVGSNSEKCYARIQPLELRLVSEGDYVSYRKLGNKLVWVVEVNGKRIGSCFGAWDYISLILFILLIAGYIYIPKLYGKLKKEDLRNCAFS